MPLVPTAITLTSLYFRVDKIAKDGKSTVLIGDNGNLEIFVCDATMS